MDLVELSSDRSAPRHPWELARFSFFRRILREVAPSRARPRILDVGAGDAWFATRLAADLDSEIVCWDVGYESVSPVSSDPRVRFTAVRPDGDFDVILALDVAEHVPDDRGWLTGIVGESLSSGGHLLFSVPAWPALFSGHDERLRHVRRYTPAAARALLRAAGLEPVRAGGLFHALLAARAVQVAVERLSGRAPGHAGSWAAPAAITQLLRSILEVEGRLSSGLAKLGIEAPGLSWWALCRKP